MTSGPSRSAESSMLSPLSQKISRLISSRCASCLYPYDRHLRLELDSDRVGFAYGGERGGSRGSNLLRSARLNGSVVTPQSRQALRPNDLMVAPRKPFTGPDAAKPPEVDLTAAICGRFSNSRSPEGDSSWFTHLDTCGLTVRRAWAESGSRRGLPEPNSARFRLSSAGLGSSSRTANASAGPAPRGPTSWFSGIGA
jgi:hypothetical protein